MTTVTVEKSPASAAQARAARRTRELTELLLARPDLVGTHAPADFAFEALRWTV
jgi:hypothetical protein